jgi:hypothetical protein
MTENNSCEILKGIEAADVLPNRLTDTLIFSLSIPSLSRADSIRYW